MAQTRKKQRRAAIDLEEIAPNRFHMYELRAAALLKGEGELSGRGFTLTSWRRDGLLARLRERGLHVSTLADQIEALPTPPPPPPIAGRGWRALASEIEQFSHFDLRRMRWHPIAPESRDGAPGVTLYGGWALRRRKGRGASSYYLALVERGGGIGLRPLDETTALLTGYAQALALDDRPLLVERRDGHYLLPNVDLPPSYRALLGRVARPTEAGPEADAEGWPLAQELFLRLGVRLRVED